MSGKGQNPKSGRPAGKGFRGRQVWGRRPAWLIMLVLLLLVVIAAYQITSALGFYDRASFLEELWGVLGMVALFVVAGGLLGLGLAGFRAFMRKRRGPAPWEEDDGP